MFFIPVRWIPWLVLFFGTFAGANAGAEALAGAGDLATTIAFAVAIAVTVGVYVPYRRWRQRAADREWVDYHVALDHEIEARVQARIADMAAGVAKTHFTPSAITREP